MDNIVAADLAQSITGNAVELSGYTAGDGAIYATRVLLERLSYTSGEEIKVQGVASHVTPVQFQIGKQIFPYETAVLMGFGEAVFSNNDFISVKTVGNVDGNNNYIATQVKFKHANSVSVILFSMHRCKMLSK